MLGYRTLTTRRAAATAAVLAVALLLLVAGCAKKQAGTGTTGTANKPPAAEAGPSVKGGLPSAVSALSTTAPDAKLLLVQTAQTVSSTGTPVWAYLFGSPSSDKTYVVYVVGGRAMGAQEYGTAGLQKSEWPAIPDPSGIVVDSDEALTKAIGASSFPKADRYNMGLVTYTPKSTAGKSKTKAFVWYVTLQSGTATATIEVDAKTGKAAKRK